MTPDFEDIGQCVGRQIDYFLNWLSGIDRKADIGLH